MKRRITFLAKAEYFRARGLTGQLTALALRGAGQISVDSSGRAAAQAAIREGLGVLAKGDLLAIYPGGTRSPDGRLYKGKVGVAVMALAAQVPVIPCAMVGTFQIWPPGRVLPRHRPVVIRFGEPLDFSRFAGMAHQRAVLRAVTDEITYAILRLSGQEYVDQYAADVQAGRRRGGGGEVPPPLAAIRPKRPSAANEGRGRACARVRRSLRRGLCDPSDGSSPRACSAELSLPWWEVWYGRLGVRVRGVSR
ncbi:hypothetical protein GCM10022206_24370 [Streptomyces chiangmaiensis]